jgi:hypothetical protein
MVDLSALENIFNLNNLLEDFHYLNMSLCKALQYETFARAQLARRSWQSPIYNDSQRKSGSSQWSYGLQHQARYPETEKTEMIVAT